LELGDDSRDPLVSDRERREAGRAVLGQMLRWAAEVEGVAAACGRDKGARADFRGWAWPKRKERFFSKLIFNGKTFPGNPKKCFKARKILKKFQKFQENSQIQIGTRTIQIKYLELMQKSLLINRNSSRKVRINSRKVRIFSEEFGQHLNVFLKPFALKKH
jgi:hypothetical protein